MFNELMMIIIIAQIEEQDKSFVVVTISHMYMVYTDVH